MCSVGFLQRESDGEKDGKDNEALRKSSVIVIAKAGMMSFKVEALTLYHTCCPGHNLHQLNEIL